MVYEIIESSYTKKEELIALSHAKAIMISKISQAIPVKYISILYI